jgi:hypothetical protein
MLPTTHKQQQKQIKVGNKSNFCHLPCTVLSSQDINILSLPRHLIQHLPIKCKTSIYNKILQNRISLISQSMRIILILHIVPV